MKTVIHHVALSHTSPNISGGERSLVEIVRYLSKFDHMSQIIYTSESGASVYKKQLREGAGKIKYTIIGSQKIERINAYLAFYLRTIQQFKHLKKFDAGDKNIIFSHDDFLPTLIFSYLLKKINEGARWLAFFHMKCPSIWRGFEGEYTNRFKLPSLRLMRYKLEQWLFLKLTPGNISKIVTVNPIYTEFLSKYYENVYTLKVIGCGSPGVAKGSSSHKIDIGTRKERDRRDLVFMARFHAQKGIFEMIDILKKVKQTKKNIKLVILGGGAPKIENQFFKMVKENGLTDNIRFLGYISGDAMYAALQHSKIFLFPSYYESSPQAVLEAMSCGLPVVAYDLPPFQVFKKGMVKVPILDNDKMAKEILKLLDDSNYYNKIKNEAVEFSSGYSWDKTGAEIYDLIIHT